MLYCRWYVPERVWVYGYVTRNYLKGNITCKIMNTIVKSIKSVTSHLAMHLFRLKRVVPDMKIQLSSTHLLISTFIYISICTFSFYNMDSRLCLGRLKIS